MEPITRASGHGNVAALTFDDGPNGPVTDALLDFLGRHGIPAVFCVIGANIERADGRVILRRMVRDGHVLCSHGMSYDDMGAWSADRIRDDLSATMRTIRSTLADAHAPVPFFRAPNGTWGSTVPIAESLGMKPLGVVNTIDDWRTQDVETLTSNLRAAMRPGELVLMHDGGGDRWGTLAAVRTVVEERLADGWRFTLPASG